LKPSSSIRQSFIARTRFSDCPPAISMTAAPASSRRQASAGASVTAPAPVTDAAQAADTLRPTMRSPASV